VIVEVDSTSPVPPYEQLRRQIERLTASGVLQPGDQLPAIRQLAGDLGLAPGTVARAYRELESAGILVSKGRHGTQVAERSTRPPAMTAAERSRLVAEAAAVFAIAVRQLGADPQVAIKHAQDALAD
jgi:DNA-binding transcriptional regulator YhcF (GntR family)